VKQLIELLNQHPTPVVSTTTLAQLTLTPEWKLADLLEPMIRSGKLRSYGQNKFDIDLWLYSKNAKHSLTAVDSLCLARLKRTSKYVEAYIKNHEVRSVAMHLADLVKGSGFSTEVVRQVKDIIHLLAKGQSQDEIQTKGYCLNFDDLPEWIDAINRFELNTSLYRRPKNKSLYKIIDRFGFSEPKVIGIAYVEEGNINNLIAAVGEYVFDMEEVTFISSQQIINLSHCRFELQPATEAEEQIYFGDLDVIDQEPLMLVSFQREHALYRGHICKVLTVDSEEPAFYETFPANVHQPGNIDLGSADCIRSMLELEEFGRPPEFLNNNTRQKLETLLACHQEIEQLPRS
jgi:hypothetical protein